MSAAWIAGLQALESNYETRGLSMLGISDFRSRLVLAVEIVRTDRRADLVEAIGRAVVAHGIPEFIGFGEDKDSLRKGLAEALAGDAARPTDRTPGGPDRVRFSQLFRRHYWNPGPDVRGLELRGSRIHLERWRELQLRPPKSWITMHAG